MRRTRHEVGRHAGRTTLAQTFRFENRPGSNGVITAVAIGEALRTAPLVGPEETRSIFGDRPGEEQVGERDEAGSRRLRGFSPAPGFRFDVDLTEREPGVFVVSFSQPGMRSPYLEGDAVWLLGDVDHEVTFEEEINTERALAAGATPLTGPRPSLRRWLFFRVGHAKVMTDATGRIAGLA